MALDEAADVVAHAVVDGRDMPTTPVETIHAMSQHCTAARPRRVRQLGSPFSSTATPS